MQATVVERHLNAEHLFARGAEAVSQRPGLVGGYHAAERGGRRADVQRQPLTDPAQRGADSTQRGARADRRDQVVRLVIVDPAQPAKVDQHVHMRRWKSPVELRTRATAHDGETLRRGDAQYGRDLLGIGR